MKSIFFGKAKVFLESSPGLRTSSIFRRNTKILLGAVKTIRFLGENKDDWFGAQISNWEAGGFRLMKKTLSFCRTPVYLENPTEGYGGGQRLIDAGRSISEQVKGGP